MHLSPWYAGPVCHQYDVCEKSVSSVYIGGHGGLSERGLYVFRKLCPASLPAVGECPSAMLQPALMSYVDCGHDGQVI